MLTIHERNIIGDTLIIDDVFHQIINGTALIVSIGPGDVIDDDTAAEFEALEFSMEDEFCVGENDSFELAYVLAQEGAIDPTVREAVQNIVDDFNSSFTI